MFCLSKSWYLVALSLVGGCVGSVGSSSDPDTNAVGGSGGGRAGASASAGGSGGASASGGNGVITIPDNPAVAPTKFSCDASKAPPGEQLRRLTTTQYLNTLKDLVALATKTNANTAWQEITPATSSLRPDQKFITDDEPHGSFRRLDQVVGSGQVEGYYTLADAVANALTRDKTRLGTLAGTCATDADTTNDAKCVTDFIKTFGERVLRRPLSAADVDFYTKFYLPSTGIDLVGFHDVISAMLQSPDFVYMIEHGDAATKGKDNVYDLNAYEAANRLSYHFWQTMPDDTLWQAAKSGALDTATGYEAQVNRMFSDARTKASVDEFYTDYFKLEGHFKQGGLDRSNNDAQFKAFAGDNLPSSGLEKAMGDEILGMADYFTWRDGNYSDLLTSNRAFAKTPELAKIYGLPVWDGNANPPTFSSSARTGILTRAFYLAASSIPTTSPILKGAFIRRTILCDRIPPPPPGVNTTPPPADPDMTRRQLTENLTEKNGQCVGCHGTLINNLGYATENFDGLGRERSEEILYDSKGAVSKRVPVNTVAVPRIDPDLAADQQPKVTGAPELMKEIVDSSKGQACMARNYFRFTFARWEDVDIDGCVLERLRTGLAAGKPLASVLKDVALAPEFRQRSFR